MIDHTNYTDPYTTVTPDIESRVMRAINRIGREPHWFNVEAACN